MTWGGGKYDAQSPEPKHSSTGRAIRTVVVFKSRARATLVHVRHGSVVKAKALRAHGAARVPQVEELGQPVPCAGRVDIQDQAVARSLRQVGWRALTEEMVGAVRPLLKHGQSGEVDAATPRALLLGRRERQKDVGGIEVVEFVVDLRDVARVDRGKGRVACTLGPEGQCWTVVGVEMNAFQWTCGARRRTVCRPHLRYVQSKCHSLSP